ncbi:U3 small nucleolar RNA-associated protein 6 [Nitzschia inconspicua]|uniref:U3 small nucleolar RNA-associated protein 6 n=1 Tax=Nitzschia inconspicua TaxID=303405 RepID=A0A9K3LUH9_9STRA|nr:U3 small nucleolar RNA-associated protein 6 [Nitzschia inconspicua]
MAEHVQAALDQMVAPLKDLMDRNIFSSSEIKAIVARRRESEYLLRRVAARKADFLRYIEQEMALERLRELRTLQRKRDHRKSQQKWNEDENDDDNDDKTKKGSKEKEHIGDVHIVQHIHLLFVRAIRKFRSDLSLHLEHAEFCKQQRSWTRLGRVYSEALQIFPRQPGLWIEAASHEFFGPARNIRNARVLLQRGLRINGKSEELWLQYFMLEMHYAQTLKGRRQILVTQQKDSTETKEESSAEEEYKIPSIVLKNAFQAISSSVQFRLKFMDACKQFPQVDLLMNFIQESITNDFSSEPESWIARALFEAERQNNGLMNQVSKDDTPKRQRKKQKTEDNDAVISVLRDAIEEIKTDEMLLQAYRFAESYLKELHHLGMDGGRIKMVLDFIEDLWERAKDCKSCDLAIAHTDYLVNAEQQQKALERIKSFCTTQTSVPSKAWFRWASLAPTQSQRGILETALKKTTMDSPDHVKILLQLFGSQLESKEIDAKLHDTLQRILLLAPKTTDDVIVEDTGLSFELSTIHEAFLAFLLQSYEKSGLTAARKVYSAVLFRFTTVLSERNVDGVEKFVNTCLDLEKSAPEVDKKRLLRLYDKALSVFAGTPLEDVYRERRNDEAVFD